MRNDMRSAESPVTCCGTAVAQAVHGHLKPILHSKENSAVAVSEQLHICNKEARELLFFVQQAPEPGFEFRRPSAGCQICSHFQGREVQPCRGAQMSVCDGLCIISKV